MPNLFTSSYISRATIERIVAEYAASRIHHTQHEKGGPDEISLTGLTPDIHHTRHEKGGPDEIDCTGLKGAGGGGIPWDDLYLQLLFESLDGYRKDIEGSGYCDLDHRYVTIGTGSTAHSVARLTKRNVYTMPSWNWSKDSRFRAQVNIRFRHSATGRAWITVGDRNEAKHYGFKVENGILYGTTGDGSIETDVELQTLGTDSFEVTLSLDAKLTAEEKVEFYVDGVKLGEIATNLPVGEDPYARWIYLYVNNRNAAEDKRIRTSQWMYYQKA